MGLVVHLKCGYNQDTINFQTYCMVGHVVASLALSSHLLNIYTVNPGDFVHAGEFVHSGRLCSF